MVYVNTTTAAQEAILIGDSPEESDLLARARLGDQDAYAELVRNHAPMALRTATVLGAGADAEDVVQEAFVKAYRALSRFREGASFRPWLLQIVANETRNLQRAARRRTARDSEQAAMATRLADQLDPLEVALSHERADRLLAALGELPERYRQVVACRFLLDLDEAATAQVLALPRGTVKSRLSRALSKLREQLAEARLGVSDGG